MILARILGLLSAKELVICCHDFIPLLNEQGETVSPEQVQFCYAIVQGKPHPRIPYVELLPKNDIFKNSDFKFYPGIFALWAYRQENAQEIVKKLQQLFPTEPLPEGFKAASIHEIRNYIREYIFPRVKSSLFPMLQNFASLAGA